ncbi:hypothetical protein IWZ01DRAFT_516394 [Phyllosticta capitalensis]
MSMLSVLSMAVAMAVVSNVSEMLTRGSEIEHLCSSVEAFGAMMSGGGAVGDVDIVNVDAAVEECRLRGEETRR